MKKIMGLMAAGFLVAGCTTMSPPAATATAKLEPTKGNTANGTVTFTKKGDKVQVNAKVAGLTPGGHGFHIHEKGDCSSGDGMSTGGHFNPRGKPHAVHTTPDRHTGDMPMLVADASGNAIRVAVSSRRIDGGSAQPPTLVSKGSVDIGYQNTTSGNLATGVYSFGRGPGRVSWREILY